MNTEILNQDEEYSVISQRLEEIEQAKEVIKRIIDLSHYNICSDQILEFAILEINKENNKIDFEIEKMIKQILKQPFINPGNYELFKLALDIYIKNLLNDIRINNVMVINYFNKDELDEFVEKIKELISKKEANLILREDIKRLLLERDYLLKEQRKLKRNHSLRKIKEKLSFIKEKK